MNADGSEQTRLTNNPADDFDAAWLPRAIRREGSMRRLLFLTAAAFILAVALAACAEEEKASTASPTATVARTATPAATRAPQATATRTATKTPQATVTPTLVLPTSTNTGAGTGINEYSSETYGFSFTVPNGMNLYTAENPGPLASQISSTAPFILVNPDFTEENINVQVAENVSEGDLASLRKELDENLNWPLPEYERVSVGSIGIGKQGNKTAVEHVFIMKGNILGKLRQVTFVHRGRGFTFTCATAVERFDTANEKFFDALFGSLEFR